MTPSTSGFQEPDHDRPAGSGQMSRARTPDGNLTSTAFHEELRVMLGTEMARHQPDSDRIRRRLAAAAGQPPGRPSPLPPRQPGSVSPLGARPGAVPQGRSDTAAGPPPGPAAGPESTTPIEVGASLTADDEAAAYPQSRLPAEAEPHGDAEPDGLDALIDLTGPLDLHEPAEEADRVDSTAPLSLDPLYGTRRGRTSAVLPRRGRGPGRAGRAGRRRAQALVGAAVTVLSLALVALVALLDLPGSDSTDPPTTTVTARPRPTETPWATTSATLDPSRPPAAYRPPSYGAFGRRPTGTGQHGQVGGYRAAVEQGFHATVGEGRQTRPGWPGPGRHRCGRHQPGAVRHRHLRQLRRPLPTRVTGRDPRRRGCVLGAVR